MTVVCYGGYFTFRCQCLYDAYVTRQVDQDHRLRRLTLSWAKIKTVYVGYFRQVYDKNDCK